MHCAIGEQFESISGFGLERWNKIQARRAVQCRHALLLNLSVGRCRNCPGHLELESAGYTLGEIANDVDDIVGAETDCSRIGKARGPEEQVVTGLVGEDGAKVLQKWRANFWIYRRDRADGQRRAVDGNARSNR